MIVEDHAINRLLMRKFLDRQGATSDMAKNGKEAIEQAGTTYYDAILMDLFMPDTSGIEATRHLRGQGKNHAYYCLYSQCIGRSKERSTGCRYEQFYQQAIYTERIIPCSLGSNPWA